MMKLYLTSIASFCLITACTPTAMHHPSLALNPKVQQPPLKHPAETPTTASNAQLTSWQLSGAIAAQSHHKGWAASLSWQQQGPDQYLIHLYGPLGGGAVMIEKKNALITFRDGPQQFSAKNADDLLQRHTGIRLPVQNLYFWVRGIPAPGTIQTATYDTNHRLTSLTQAGYTIDFAHYMLIHRMMLPSKIRLQGHDILVKLVIKRWDEALSS